MDMFPRTVVGGVECSRMIIGCNWFLGYSHTSLAKDRFIKEYQDGRRVSEVLAVFLRAGVDMIMGMPVPMLREAISLAQDKVGRELKMVLTPSFNIKPGGPPEKEPDVMFDMCRDMGATFCFPHQCTTDALMDRRDQVIRDLGKYTAMIRQRGMIPGLSTHAPDTIPVADAMNADIATYIQIYNAAGFLMQVEADWVMRVISKAKLPVMTIKPMAAGRLLPAVGLAFVWNTIRDQDLVTVGCATPDEAAEVIELSMDFLNRRLPTNKLQTTRSKKSLEPA